MLITATVKRCLNFEVNEGQIERADINWKNTEDQLRPWLTTQAVDR